MTVAASVMIWGLRPWSPDLGGIRKPAGAEAEMPFTETMNVNSEAVSIQISILDCAYKGPRIESKITGNYDRTECAVYSPQNTHLFPFYSSACIKLFIHFHA